LIAGGAGVIAAAALWTVLASIVRVPPNALPDTRGVPALTLAAILIVSVIAAPLTEEMAFRGYAMGLLRRRFSPPSALLITSALFAAAHLTQGLYAPKLLVYFLAGLVFGLVALRTGSLLPAMVVHSFADLTFFTLVWPHDAGRRLVGAGAPLGPVLAGAAVCAICLLVCTYAFGRLSRVTSSPGKDLSPARARAAAARATRGRIIGL
jgi:membrane protease YdiL (CAAX protease family)